MLETLDIFEGGKKQTKDYHGMFDHTYFFKWREKLLRLLEQKEIKNGIIIMERKVSQKTSRGHTSQKE
jgi:hypothetical protein